MCGCLVWSECLKKCRWTILEFPAALLPLSSNTPALLHMLFPLHPINLDRPNRLRWVRFDVETTTNSWQLNARHPLDQHHLAKKPARMKMRWSTCWQMDVEVVAGFRRPVPVVAWTMINSSSNKNSSWLADQMKWPRICCSTIRKMAAFVKLPAMRFTRRASESTINFM